MCLCCPDEGSGSVDGLVTSSAYMGDFNFTSLSHPACLPFTTASDTNNAFDEAFLLS